GGVGGGGEGGEREKRKGEDQRPRHCGAPGRLVARVPSVVARWAADRDRRSTTRRPRPRFPGRKTLRYAHRPGTIARVGSPQRGSLDRRPRGSARHRLPFRRGRNPMKSRWKLVVLLLAAVGLAAAPLPGG